MKHIAIYFLVACSSGSVAYVSDSSDSSVVTIDAAPPQNHECSMGNLPASRSKTYVNGDPVDAAILNELQDQIILLASDPLTFNIALAATASGSSASLIDIGGFPGMALNTSSQPCWLPLIIPVGYNIVKWQVQLQKNSSSGTITAKLFNVNGINGTGSQIGSTQSNGTNAPGNIQLGQTVSSVMAAGHSAVIVVNGGGVNGDFVVGYSVN